MNLLDCAVEFEQRLVEQEPDYKLSSTLPYRPVLFVR
jgi:hypothetical protein